MKYSIESMKDILLGEGSFKIIFDTEDYKERKITMNAVSKSDAANKLLEFLKEPVYIKSIARV